MFECNPYIDHVIVMEQVFLNQDIYIFATNLLGKRKELMNTYIPEMESEMVFHRVVNRIYELLAFPRIRSITMDDFFQQMKLDINDFEIDEPKIYCKPEEMEYGISVKKTLVKKDGDKMVGIHLFSADSNRMIDPTMARTIIDNLLETGYKVVIFGSGKEADYNNFKDVSSKMSDMALFLNGYKDNPNVSYQCNDISIREKIGLVSMCDYFIACVSGFMHIAWLHKVPTISLLRPQEVANWDAFMRVTGYFWAIAEEKPYASYIVYKDTGYFEGNLIARRIKELTK